MYYQALAFELLSCMPMVRKIKPQKIMDEAVHGEAFVLGYIARHGGELTPGEISQGVDVSAARIATTLGCLEKKGLITRKIDPDNRRKILVMITEEGRGAAEEQQKCVVETVMKMLEFLGAQDATEYVRIMKRLSEIPPDFYRT